MSRQLKIYPNLLKDDWKHKLDEIAFYYMNKGYRVCGSFSDVEIESNFHLLAIFKFEYNDKLGSILMLSFKALSEDQQFYTNEDIKFIKEVFEYFNNFEA